MDSALTSGQLATGSYRCSSGVLLHWLSRSCWYRVSAKKESPNGKMTARSDKNTAVFPFLFRGLGCRVRAKSGSKGRLVCASLKENILGFSFFSVCISREEIKKRTRGTTQVAPGKLGETPSCKLRSGFFLVSSRPFCASRRTAIVER